MYKFFYTPLMGGSPLAPSPPCGGWLLSFTTHPVRRLGVNKCQPPLRGDEHLNIRRRSQNQQQFAVPWRYQPRPYRTIASRYGCSPCGPSRSSGIRCRRCKHPTKYQPLPAFAASDHRTGSTHCRECCGSGS